MKIRVLSFFFFVVDSMIKGNLMKGYKAQPCSAVGCSCGGSWAAFAATGLSLGPPTSGKCADLLETMDVFKSLLGSQCLGLCLRLGRLGLLRLGQYPQQVEVKGAETNQALAYSPSGLILDIDKLGPH